MVATDRMTSGVKNGFKSGNRGLLVPGTGVSSWLDFMKIFIEVSKTVNHLTIICTIMFKCNQIIIISGALLSLGFPWAPWWKNSRRFVCIKFVLLN